MMTVFAVIGVIGLIFCVACLGVMVLIVVLANRAARNDDYHVDIHITHHNGNYGYYFHDQYGNMISRGGFRSSSGALHAAKRERDAVARDLQKAMGL